MDVEDSLWLPVEVEVRLTVPEVELWLEVLLRVELLLVNEKVLLSRSDEVVFWA